MKRQWIAVIGFFLAFPGFGLAQQIDWQTDLDSAKTLAAEQDKLVLLHFSAEWCRPCKNLETFVFTSPKVISAFQARVIAVHVDTDTHPDLVKQYNVTEIPSDVVISTSGRVLQKRQSPKDTSNYLRMIQSLDAVSHAMSEDRAALAQKIDEVLDNGTAKEIVSPESNDFVARHPETQRAEPAREAELLQSDFESRARLVGHQAEGQLTSLNEPAPQSESIEPVLERKASSPQRVINDQFFVEKTTAANAASGEPMDVGSTTSFVPSQSRATLQTPDSTNVVTGTLSPAINRNRSNTLAPVDIQQGFIAGDEPSAKIVSVEPIHATEQQEIDSAESRREFAAENVDTGRQSQPDASASFGLDGKCPVTLIQDGKWVSGDDRFGCVHRGRTYLFADQAKLILFQRDPDLYSPILAGFDPVLFYDRGELVEGLEQHGVFMGKAPNQRIVLFQSETTRAKFQENPRQYMDTIRQAVSQSDSLK